MKESLKLLEKALPSKSAEASVDLLCKLLSNVVDSPQEPKFRTVKRENKRVKELLTGNKHGEKLMTLVGFSLVDPKAKKFGLDTDPEHPEKNVTKAEHSYRLP